MSGIISYLFHQTQRQKLPRLKKSLINGRDLEPIDLNQLESVVLGAGLARDHHEARKLLKKYQATNQLELIAMLPTTPRPDWRRRLKNWIRQLEGAYRSDPHRAELRDLLNRQEYF